MGDWEDYCQTLYGNKDCDQEGRKFQRARKRATNDDRRRFLSPIKIDTLSDIEALYEGEIMSEEIGKEDVVRFSLGREVSGQELIKHAAGHTLTELAKQHMKRHEGKVTFSEALHIVSRICPGETKAYLNLKRMAMTDDSFLVPRGIGKKMSQIVFLAADGWTEAGVRDWVKQQGLTGGELARNAGGWSYTPQKRT